MSEISPKLEHPLWFSPYVAKLEESYREPLRLAFSAPPQHGKTEAAVHALVWGALHFPTLKNAYVTFSVQRAQDISRDVQAKLTLAGVEFEGTLSTIRLKAGGTIRFVSIEQGLIGEPVTGLCLIDDPYKSDADAASPKTRDRVEQVWRTTIVPRLHPSASVIVMHTRWHPSDFIAMLHASGVEYINITAIAEAGDPLGRLVGAPLCPSFGPGPWAQGRNLAFLATKQREMGELAFQQQYQGRPRLRGAGVFREPARYTALPTAGYRVAYGVDLAYTEATRADWSVLVELWRVEQPPGPDGLERPLFYVVDVHRAQQEIADFAAVLQAASHRRKDAPMAWRCAGVERGAGSLLKRPPYALPLQLKTPPGDKYVSATPLSIAWNDARVLVPDQDWFPSRTTRVADYVARFLDFTGAKNGETDDEIDATGTAHALLPSPPKMTNLLPKRSKAW